MERGEKATKVTEKIVHNGLFEIFLFYSVLSYTTYILLQTQLREKEKLHECYKAI